ncbi:hypothetical protein RhiJN_04280 [Ceratobasidium sp. AG-Ba]|nr:hypothetical protein RhiJN_04280 [Ceratobasidium sp. AG-Ba]QRW05170.1 hypothetical protein RhiLY_04169 [Ceratobasidium sp. AG-Ba]
MSAASELSPPHPPVDHDIGVRPVNMSSASSTAEFVLPPPTPETLRRRAQSDRASSEIGARMLKGWAMLSEECMNDDCWAIPLVRPPRARPGAQPDPRKECVVCGRIYTTNENGELVLQSSPAGQSLSSSRRPEETAAATPNNTTETEVRDVPRELFSHVRVPAPAPAPVSANSLPSAPTASFSPMPQQPVSSTSFISATGALQGALDSLSHRLTQVTMAPNMDVRQVKDTAEAMEAVMRTLHTARQISGNV